MEQELIKQLSEQVERLSELLAAKELEPSEPRPAPAGSGLMHWYQHVERVNPTLAIFLKANLKKQNLWIM